MAKKQESSKFVLERAYNVPLRRESRKVANWRRTQKAAKGLKEFLAKHMKVENRDVRLVKIGRYANEYLWRHGIRNPPHHIKVVAKKDDKGIVYAELEGAPIEKPKEEKKGKKKEVPKEEKNGKKEEDKPEVKGEKKPSKEEKKAETKTEEKPAKKEAKKETIVDGTKPSTEPAVETPE